MTIPFTDNYEDLSSENGFQFKFKCEKCGNGYVSSFQKSSTGILSNVANIASNFFGGAGSSVANTTDSVHRMVAGPQHDAALDKAVQEIKPKFEQCSRCGKWVCKEICWNQERNLCKECAPELGEEMASAQASHSRDEAWAHANMSKQEKHLKAEDWADMKKALCPNCKTRLKAHVKFCPECGASINAKMKCKKCSADLDAGVKFCAECGEKQ